MSDLDLSDLGLNSNPFDTIIGDQESSKKYRLFGRENQLQKAEFFVKRAIKEQRQQRMLVRGEYGTGKTHHLLRLQDEIRSGVYGDGAIAVYLGNLGISIRRFYEKFIESFGPYASDFQDTLADLPPVEPDDSIDQSYKKERLRDNVIANIEEIVAASQLKGYTGIFLLIDEAEDIVQSSDNDEIQYFVQTLLHLVNYFSGTPLHFIMGFSREALAKITVVNGTETTENRLGDALIQRFQNNDEIVLGYLSEKDVLAMVRDRLNSSRVTPNDSLYPLHEGVVNVVARLTGGHPREILSILNKGLLYAQKSGIKEVDGGCILWVLATHTSFFDKENVVLDIGALTRITTAIRERDENLSTDFERLQGKLIGEEAEISVDEFNRDSNPDILTQPIQGIRVLERKFSEYGETTYVIHQEIKNEIFKGKRYDSDIEQNLDRELIELMQNPEHYQSQLTKGLWTLMQNEWMAEYKTDTSCSSYEVIVGNVRVENSPTPVSVAFAAYKGREFPPELYNGILDLLDKKDATVGFVLYEGFHFGSDPNYIKFKNTIRNTENQRFFENICSVGVQELSDTRDTMMGMIKLLGNREIDAIEEIDTTGLFETIGADKKITELIEEKAIAFPEENRRKTIDFLASESLKSFSIKELNKNLNLNYIDRAFMQGLQHQHFVETEGSRWKIATLDQNPPWKSIFTFIGKKSRATAREIWEYIEDNYIVQTPPGDEMRMVSWYLEILQKQNMIASESDHGEIFHKPMDFSGQVNQHLATIETELETYRELVPLAEKFQISVSNDKSAIAQYSSDLDSLQDEFEYNAQNVEECKNLIETIIEKRKKLDREIKNKKEEFTSGVDNKNTQVEQLLKLINRGCNEGYISEIEKDEWIKTLNDTISDIEEDLTSEDYTHLVIASNDIDEHIKTYIKQIDDRKNSKEPCIAYAQRYSNLSSTCEKTLASMEEGGYTATEKRTIFNDLTKQYKDRYNPLFNDGKFNEAKECIKKIYTELQNLNQDLKNIHTQYTSYSKQIEEYRTISGEDTGLIDILKKAQNFLDEWNFANVEIELRKYNDLRTSRKEVIKTPEEKLLDDYGGQIKVPFQDIKGVHSIDETFEYIRNLYQKGKISDIEISFK
ncbi:hypothetical protein E2N92_00705 [Methanofollis formosanus]|uniref:ORC1/DEAH AAA+ ATPase domain-containing protein n=1 Tax=Methanofollis formosanus TaxID=299308 RepID=A0A8G0ZXU6_9EURY|nr:ATP-binding protein [Methanofollis formosanus]QYZ78052.1 hypothetical protein E2N92_00705 [Methanofollis formosanus]